jgi:hypothetical protein
MRYFIRYNPAKKFVQKLYRLVTEVNILQYHGEQGDWHFSFSYNNKKEEFLSSPLTEEVTKEEMKEYIATE